jgi:hypothetical protein
MPWDISAVTCNNDLEGTNFVHRFDLGHVIRHMRMIIWAYEAYLKRQTFRGIQWPVPGLRNWCSAGGATSPIAGAPWRGWDHAREPGDRRPLPLRTIGGVSDGTFVRLGSTNLLLLLVHVTDLEPDVLLSQRPRRVSDDVFEALQEG